MRNTNGGGLYRHPNNAALKVVTDTPVTPGLIGSSPNLMALPKFDKRVGLGRITKTGIQKLFRLTGQRQPLLEGDILLEERSRERARIAHELHDTVLQGFLAASLLLHLAVEQTPADSPSKSALSRALRLVHRAIDEGRAAIRGLHSESPAPSSLEEALSNFLNEVAPGRSAQLRIFVQGKPRGLEPAIQEQLFLIAREAVMNALRHSQATTIEVQVQYLRDLLRVLIRDNGCGIEPEAVQKARDSHWGLRGMRDRAEKIGARFDIWSSSGAGTEVRVAVAVDGVKLITHDCGPWQGRTAI
jgi:signal transduction histidine kinase